MTALQFHQFTARGDNYCVLVHDPVSGKTASIDAPSEKEIREALESKGWELSHILVTHHHYDHVEAIEPLKKRYGCKIIAPTKEASKIPLVDETVGDGDEIDFAGNKVIAIETAGHTLGMINYHFVDAEVVFTGDTLFAMGCGRVFEGDGPMMHKSMQKLAQLPPQTTVYCGHEYTKANANFALSVDGKNEALLKRASVVNDLRAKDLPTLPTTIELELETNPFLRTSNPAIRANLDMENASDAEIFTKLREMKDKA